MTARVFQRIHGLGKLRLADGTLESVRYALTSYAQRRPDGSVTDVVLQGHIEAGDWPGLPTLAELQAKLELADGRRLDIVLQRPEYRVVGRSLPFTVKA